LEKRYIVQVSVICPVFNSRPDELRDAVASALGQRGGGIFEIILIDDASSSRETIGELNAITSAHASVKLIRSPKGLGPGQARNLGLSQASGEWISFLDADDLWPSTKLEQARALLRERPSARWIIGDFAHFREKGPDPVSTGASCFSLAETSPLACTPTLTRSIILDGVHLGTCLIHRTIVERERFEPGARFGEDLLFLARLSLKTCANRAAGLSYLCRRQHESLMYSESRLTSAYASGLRFGIRDKSLRGFRREYRWALYDLYKELAANNVLNGRRMRGLKFALLAYALDPRELFDIARFARLLVSHPTKLKEAARVYSRREQFELPVPTNR
jgi:glycosyltransferase involved in cell wall biosynthesis